MTSGFFKNCNDYSFGSKPIQSNAGCGGPSLSSSGLSNTANGGSTTTASGGQSSFDDDFDSQAFGESFEKTANTFLWIAIVIPTLIVVLIIIGIVACVWCCCVLPKRNNNNNYYQLPPPAVGNSPSASPPVVAAIPTTCSYYQQQPSEQAPLCYYPKPAMQTTIPMADAKIISPAPSAEGGVKPNYAAATNNNDPEIVLPPSSGN